MAFLKRAEFPGDHPFGQILVTPDMEGSPDVWLLGSSGWSADAAAQLGLPYAAAHFINPDPTRASIEHYRRSWEKSGHEGEPQVLVCVGAVAAETEEEAQFHYAPASGCDACCATAASGTTAQYRRRKTPSHVSPRWAKARLR